MRLSGSIGPATPSLESVVSLVSAAAPLNGGFVGVGYRSDHDREERVTCSGKAGASELPAAMSPVMSRRAANFRVWLFAPATPAEFWSIVL